MQQTTIDCTLTTDDIAAFHALLKVQENLGPGMPSAGLTQLWNFFGVLNDMAYDRYRLTTNTELKSWMEEVFHVVMTTNTCYIIDGKSLTVAGMYVIYMYYQFNACCMTNADFTPDPQCGRNGFPANASAENASALPWCNETLANAWPWNWFGPSGISGFYAPTSVPSFFDAYTQNANLLYHGVALQQGSTLTIALETNVFKMDINKLNSIQQFEQSRFDPVNWTDSNLFVQALQHTAIWQNQRAQVTSLLKESTLTSDAYFYLLHLLIALGTSTADDRQFVLKIVNTAVNSIEYPNDTFINQLLYCSLMYLADPLGDFDYNNTQLQALLNDINSCILSTDSASAIIKQSIARSLKILHADSAYPTQDLYNPNSGFSTRQSDTLAALDAARDGLI